MAIASTCLQFTYACTCHLPTCLQFTCMYMPPAYLPAMSCLPLRYDETVDTVFYTTPRYVYHIDDNAVKALTK